MSRIITMEIKISLNVSWNGQTWTRYGLHGQLGTLLELVGVIVVRRTLFEQMCFDLLKTPNETLITECDYYEYKTLPGDEEPKYHQFSNMCQVWRHHDFIITST